MFVDKEEIEAIEFVQNVIEKAIAGAVSALKGVKEDWGGNRDKGEEEVKGLVENINFLKRNSFSTFIKLIT
jgi:hypothetical protein